MNPRDFFVKFAEPDFDDFKNDPSDLRLGVHAANSIFSMRDHMFRLYVKKDPIKIHNTSSTQEYHEYITSKCPNFDLIADLCVVFKHRHSPKGKSRYGKDISITDFIEYNKKYKDSVIVKWRRKDENKVLLDILAEAVCFWKDELELTNYADVAKLADAQD